MSKGWKLGIGIPLLLIGLVLASSMGLVLAIFGSDGKLSTPGFRANGTGVAIVADDLRIDDLPDARETFTQLQATVQVDLSSAGEDVFVGVAPAAQAQAYLEGAPIDVVTDLDAPEIRTRPVRGRGRVAPPGSQDIWVATAEDGRPLEWTLLPGEWWLVVMNADGSPGIDVSGTAAVEVPVLGAFVVAVLIVGLALMAGGLAFVISAIRMGSRTRRDAPPPPPPPSTSGRSAPPRPDAYG